MPLAAGIAAAAFRGSMSTLERRSPILPVTAPMVLRICLFAAAALLLAAHFLRVGNLAIVAACLAAPLLFLYRKRWVLLALQVLAYGAATTWVVVAARLVEARLQAGQPFKLAAMIVGGVALFTLLAGLLLNSRNLRERYPL